MNIVKNILLTVFCIGVVWFMADTMLMQAARPPVHYLTPPVMVVQATADPAYIPNPDVVLVPDVGPPPTPGGS